MMLDRLELCLQHNEDRTKQLDMWVFRKDYLIQNTSFSLVPDLDLIQDRLVVPICVHLQAFDLF